MQVNPSLMLEFNDYILRENQKLRQPEKKMSRAIAIRN